jgi:hypothetical protein
MIATSALFAPVGDRDRLVMRMLSVCSQERLARSSPVPEVVSPVWSGAVYGGWKREFAFVSRRRAP